MYYVGSAEKNRVSDTDVNAPMYGRLLSAFAIATAGLASLARGVEAQSALSGEPIQITRTASGRITIDGDLSDEGWRK